MKSFIQIAFQTGHVYELPIAVVATNRATAMLALHPDEFKTMEESMADTVELFKDSLYDISDWARNNMNWSDIEPHASLIRYTAPEIDYVNGGEWSYHDYRAITAELDGGQIMKMPLEATAVMMMEAQQLCNVTVLNAQDGQPFGAVAVIIGAPAVIGAYLNTLKFTGDQLTAGAPKPFVQ